MLTEICAEIRNYFSYTKDRHPGYYKVVDGSIVPRNVSFDYPTDYIAIFGSRLNNGVHKLSDHDLVDEDEFKGAVWVMSPPKAFLDLAKEIGDWQTKYGGLDSNAVSPYYSESFGGYSYTKSAGSTSRSGGTAASTWQTAYAERLSLYRRAHI